MSTKPQQTIIELQQGNITAAMRLAQIAIENAQRILQMQVDVAREIFDDGVADAKSLGKVQSPHELIESRARLAQQMAEKMFACSRTIAGLTAEMQSEMGKTVSERLTSNGQEIVNTVEELLQGMPLNNHAAAEALQHTFESARKSLEQATKASSDVFSAYVQNANKWN